MTFANAKAFANWHASATADLTHRWKGRDIEGFVVEDARGFMTKVKLPHYSFWKTMRSALERLPKLRADLQAAQTQSPPSPQLVASCEERLRRTLRKDAHPLARAFLSWADQLPPDDLRLDVLALRRRFLAEQGLPEKALETPWARFDREAMSRQPKGSGAPLPQSDRPPQKRKAAP